jgi:hypothetical protein
MNAHQSWFGLASASGPLSEGATQLLGERLEQLVTPAVRPEHTLAVNLGEGALVAVVAYHSRRCGCS